jgi:hypothetical protein
VTNDVLIVGRPGDAVARRLERALTARGHTATWLDGPTAARLFTIRVTAAGNQVEPDLPIFIRPMPWWGADAEATADARFLRNECHATFQAAAALCRRPVINRPKANGPVYRLTAGSLGTEAAGRSEIHASGPEQIVEDDSSFWGENAEYRLGALATLPPGVPVRARRVDVAAGYEIVTVGRRPGISRDQGRSIRRARPGGAQHRACESARCPFRRRHLGRDGRHGGSRSPQSVPR